MSENEPITMEECKQIELGILRQILKICEKYHLRYILDYGTLIGAVRHGGFIPWDDDIDLSMPRPDYEVFRDVFQKETGKESCYELRTGMDGNLALPYIQVIHRGVVTRKKGRRDCYSQALWVDVFPIDGAGNDVRCIKDIYDGYWERIKYSRKIIGRYKPYRNPWKQVQQFYWHYVKKYRLGAIIRDTQKWMQTYDYDTSQNVFCYPTIYGTKEQNEKSFYEDTIMMEFEGIPCRVPREYDKKLRGIYGDYMQYPPEHKRKGHDYLAYWRENDCS